MCVRAVISVGLVLASTVFAHGQERRINTWLVAGPFGRPHPQLDPRKFGFWVAELNHDFLGGETAIKPALGAKAAGKTWMLMDDRLYCRNQDDYVDLSTWFMPRRKGAPVGGNEHVAAYAHVYVWSPEKREVQLLLGASDGLKAWINGSLLATLPFAERQPIRDQYAFPLILNAGWNRLLIKSVNAYRIWGFYAKLANSDGKPLDGLEYSADAPDGELAIHTTQWPKGYTGWPYVWLTVKGVKPLHSAPSASPLRLMAQGGKPPYSWIISSGHLPPGLSLDSQEGEVLGTCGERTGSWEFELRVTDAAGDTATATVNLDVAERPTKWYEDEKIGGLIHGSIEAEAAYHKPYGFPERQADLMAREGYKWAAQTMGYYPDPTSWPGWYNPEYKKRLNGFSFTKHDEYKKAFEARGIGFGSYLGLTDAATVVYQNFYSTNVTQRVEHWARYLDSLHQYVEEWFAYARPVVVYLDGAGFAAPNHRLDPYDPDNKGYDFDALYSMAKTVSPKTLIIANSCGNPGLDWRLGDCDVFSTEGMNDGYNPIWDRWPIGQSGHYPKKIPNESWRYPFTAEKWGDFITNAWPEWTSSVVSLIAEGCLANLDHSVGQGREKLHQQIGSWLQARLPSLKGTRPGPVFGATWGYSVHKGNRIYLHALANKRGKVGLRSGQTRLIVKPLTVKIESVQVFPGDMPLKFTQEAGQATIDVSKVKLDPVDTIIEIRFTES